MPAGPNYALHLAYNVARGLSSMRVTSMKANEECRLVDEGRRGSMQKAATPYSATWTYANKIFEEL